MAAEGQRARRDECRRVMRQVAGRIMRMSATACFTVGMRVAVMMIMVRVNFGHETFFLSLIDPRKCGFRTMVF